MTTITAQPFGAGPSGEGVTLYTLRGASNCEVTITNYGGRIVSILAPDRRKNIADIVLGFDSLGGYLSKNPYFGALVGRYANRIANGRFMLDGITYQLERNNGENSLHGGSRGFDKIVWDAEVQTGEQGDVLVLRHVSPDGDEGYPGAVQAQVTYSLTDSNELFIEFEASTDKKTVLNLTNHSYFDLAGKQGQDGILQHVVTIQGSRFIPTNEHLIPTGELADVAGTPFDFRSPHAIGERVDEKNEQLKLALGYDHTFALDGTPGELRLVARAVDPGSGRVLDVLTTQPGVQLYSGNHLDGNVTGKGGAVYRFRTGFCLETQHFPDSPNQPSFPSTVVEPGKPLRETTVFRFGVDQ